MKKYGSEVSYDQWGVVPPEPAGWVRRGWRECREGDWGVTDDGAVVYCRAVKPAKKEGSPPWLLFSTEYGRRQVWVGWDWFKLYRFPKYVRVVCDEIAVRYAIASLSSGVDPWKRYGLWWGAVNRRAKEEFGRGYLHDLQFKRYVQRKEFVELVRKRMLTALQHAGIDEHTAVSLLAEAITLAREQKNVHGLLTAVKILNNVLDKDDGKPEFEDAEVLGAGLPESSGAWALDNADTDEPFALLDAPGFGFEDGEPVDAGGGGDCAPGICEDDPDE
jgi:hypothetical protein